MADLIAIGYDDTTTALAAMDEATLLAKDLVIQPDAIAAIIRDEEGKFKTITNQHVVGGGATWGMFWGFFFGILFFVPFLGMAIGAGLGALFGKLGKSAIDKQFQDQVREQIKPGTSALFMIVEQMTTDKALAGSLSAARPSRPHSPLKRRRRSKTHCTGPKPESPTRDVYPTRKDTRQGVAMAIGPVQLIVLGFDHPDFHGEVIDELEKLKDSDTVRVIDSLAVYKDAAGDMEVMHLSNLTRDEAIEVGSKVAALIGLGIEGEEGLEAGAVLGAEAAEEAGGVEVFDDEVGLGRHRRHPQRLGRRPHPAGAPLGGAPAGRHRSSGRLPAERRLHQPLDLIEIGLVTARGSSGAARHRAGEERVGRGPAGAERTELEAAHRRHHTRRC